MLEYLGQYLQAMISPLCHYSYLGLTMSIVVFCLFVSIILIKIREQLNLPPGPWGIPFLGSLPWVRRGAQHSWYVQLSEKYGELTSVKLGSNLLLCIGSARMIRKLFNKPDSVSRPHTPLNDLMGGRGIVLSEGLLWKKQRQFLQDKFRALGVKLGNYQRFENCVMVEVEEYLMKLEDLKGEPVDPVMLLGRHVHNVICQLMMSFRFEEDDPEFKMFNELVSKGMRLYGAIHIWEHIPSYLCLPGKKAVLKEIGRNHRQISEFHVKQLKARRRRLRECDLDAFEPADLLDYYLLEIEADKEGSTLFEGVDPDEQIVQVMNDLFSAGMETSRTTLVWLLVLMLREPEVAARVRSELEQILEPGEPVLLRHRIHLSYLEAVIFETLRIVSVVPLGTTHVNENPWKVSKYVIPAGTHLVPLLNKINMDPELFPNPNHFIPERFLVNGQLHIPNTFMPFGVGRRICLGEQLARIELFLFFANTMNCFEVYLPEGHPMPELEGVMGITHAPLPYSVCFKKIQADNREVQHG